MDLASILKAAPKTVATHDGVKTALTQRELETEITALFTNAGCRCGLISNHNFRRHF